DGEAVSNATKRMPTMTVDKVDYGRRIDLILESKDEEQQYELAANDSASNDVLKYQQSNDIRINACIKNEIDLLLNNNNTQINYLDFDGRHAYILQLFSFEGCFVTFKVDSFKIPKNLIGLSNFRSSLINLYL
ncbi:uncharacterized protein BX663DRAFT_434371, partial [Cokeromyces recurvatus]|uniref:uncharacterized protein n=1 Tax=Cokeromyces recurvatus TaxID=90255 RepID=UPI0022202E10